jgi:hypothetical protein
VDAEDERSVTVKPKEKRGFCISTKDCESFRGKSPLTPLY